jgi:hypothetical protein
MGKQRIVNSAFYFVLNLTAYNNNVTLYVEFMNYKMRRTMRKKKSVYIPKPKTGKAVRIYCIKEDPVEISRVFARAKYRYGPNVDIHIYDAPLLQQWIARKHLKKKNDIVVVPSLKKERKVAV